MIYSEQVINNLPSTILAFHDMIVNMTYQHRNKQRSIILSEVAEAFKEDYKEIQQLEGQYIAYELYLTTLKEDIDAVMDRTFGLMTKDKDFIREVLATYVDHESEDFHRVYKQYKVICGMMKPGRKNNKHRVTQEDIERARLYPIENLIEFNRAGKAECIFHTGDNTPSLHKYENTVKCFGSCGKFSDVIGVYMHQTGESFIDSVKKLSA